MPPSLVVTLANVGALTASTAIAGEIISASASAASGSIQNNRCTAASCSKGGPEWSSTERGIVPSAAIKSQEFYFPPESLIAQICSAVLHPAFINEPFRSAEIDGQANFRYVRLRYPLLQLLHLARGGGGVGNLPNGRRFRKSIIGQRGKSPACLGQIARPGMNQCGGAGNF